MGELTAVEIKGDPTMPADLCCNCGRGDDLVHPTISLKLTRFMLIGGPEWSLPVTLPFCAQCTETSQRAAPSRSAYFWAWFLWTWLVFIACVGGAMWAQRQVNPIITPALGMAGVLAAAALFAFYSRRKPREGQSSFYQPVRLLKLRQKSLGEITGMVLGFTLPRYASRFSELNSGVTPRAP